MAVRLSHDLARVAEDVGLSSFISLVAHRATALQQAVTPRAAALGIPPAVTLTYTNMAYSTGFDNWLYGTAAGSLPLSSPPVIILL